jgi:RecA/RadA recombinase
MAKKKEALNTTIETIPSFFADMLSQAQQKTGKAGIYSAEEHGKYYWGFQIQSLALQWLLGGINILPYSNFIELAGLPKSLKSTLLAEFMRMACIAGGGGAVVDVESKTGAEFYKMIVPENYLKEQRIIFNSNIKDIEEWQNLVVEYIDIKKRLDPDGKFPFVIGVDSLTARLSEDEQETVEKEGSLGQAYPRAAKLITNFLRSLTPQMLTEEDAPFPSWPILFVGINHLKENIAAVGHGKQFYTGGGAGKDFQASLRIWSKLRDKDEIGTEQLMAHLPKRLRDEGVELFGAGSVRTIQLTCEKSSLGPDGRKLLVSYYWGWTKDQRQIAWFDWDGALATLVSESPNMSDIINVKANGKKYSVYLGKEKVLSDVSNTAVGELMMANPEIVSQLKGYYHINDYITHIGNTPAKELFE